MSTTVHAVAQAGFGAGNDLYDRARPSYQANALEHIRAAIKAPAPLNILEIGSGTGIFTRALLAHPAWASALGSLRAAEPSAGMRAVFARTVTDARVSVAEGSFDATGAPDAWADAIIVAQAFHWCPDYDAAAAEFARVLKPGGVLALIWNLEDRGVAAWVGQQRDVIEAHEAGSPQFRLGLWRALFDQPAYRARFGEHREETWAYTLPGTLEIVTERAHSKSYISILSEEERAKVDREIEKIVARGEGMTWADEEKKARGEFEYPYKTTVVICEKKA
ncbi:hypothetical protein HWV62_5869 [Athelia sp. TMB]|nr:hypothetical protein HWV62_5869 [Athelia sp. TMB]